MQSESDIINNAIRPRAGRGLGVPGGMIKVTDFVIIRIPFPRQLFFVGVPDPNGGGLRQTGVVRYLYGGSWIDADSLLTRWQPWRDVVIEPSKVSAGSAAV